MIVDDEIASQKVLQHFIAKTDKLNLVETCSSASEAFEYLQLNSNTELIFLDINMPNQSGLDFYKSLKHPPSVIFTTAYPQFAVEGFEVEAIDYLLKPISYQRFLTAIGKVVKQFTETEDTSTFIILKENKTLYKFFFKDILFVEAYGDYVKVHTSDKTITTHSTFKGIKEKLPSNFMRVHKSYCINVDRLEQVAGNTIIVDKHKIPIGQTYKEKVMDKLL
jgi:DNA-binding LytR/AlgR family response regulator